MLAVWHKHRSEIRAALGRGLPGFVRQRRPAETWPAVPAFVYHAADPAELVTDLGWLARNGYATLSADELLAHLRGERAAPRRSVVLTFDDGLADLHEVAFPLLRERGMRAVAFLATAFHRRPWPGTLSWSQIREMHEAGVIDFQSHTHEHRYFPRWPRPAPLLGPPRAASRARPTPGLSMETDLAVSRSILREELGKRVRHLAFPQFDGTDAALAAARRAGFESCWWGLLPRRPDNCPGSSPWHVVRLESIYLRRLPGEDREPLLSTLRRRLAHGRGHGVGSVPETAPAT